MLLKERTSRLLLVTLLASAGWPCFGASPESQPAGKILGMYVHQHWPYNHPYAARTWTLQDWRGYAEGLSRLGYNTVLIWPMLETTPDPLTTSDEANIAKLASAIDVLHKELRMRVYLVLCPNVGCRNEEAATFTFEKRHFFYCDTRVNPGDAVALKQLIEHREKLMRPLAAADGIAIIDSDPGGYAGSTNAEFVNLLAEHRKMLDRLRPGIEMWYWMHVGWAGYCRLYQTGKYSFATAEENTDALARLKVLNPEPWGIANGLNYAEKLGIADRVINFKYGRIECEPTFPMTNFGGEQAYAGGHQPAARGVMGNAQTHCLQLPNTFAFARGARGEPIAEADYVRFADDLLIGQGPLIVDAWKALAGKDVSQMERLAHTLAQLPDAALRPGLLKGLLFGDPRRFVTDLVMQLRLRAAFESFISAVQHNQDPKEPFIRFVAAVKIWQHQHGYENAWGWPGLNEALRKLNMSSINSVLGTQFNIEAGPDTNSPQSPFEQIQASLRQTETYTTRLIGGMQKAADEMATRPGP